MRSTKIPVPILIRETGLNYTMSVDTGLMYRDGLLRMIMMSMDLFFLPGQLLIAMVF